MLDSEWGSVLVFCHAQSIPLVVSTGDMAVVIRHNAHGDVFRNDSRHQVGIHQRKRIDRAASQGSREDITHAVGPDGEMLLGPRFGGYKALARVG